MTINADSRFLPNSVKSSITAALLQRGLTDVSPYTLDEWALVCEKIDAKPSSDPKVRRFKRLFYASASVEDLDKQGRLSIPPTLMDHAAIVKDVYIVGESNTFELWSAERWIDQQAVDDGESFEELAGFLGI